MKNVNDKILVYFSLASLLFSGALAGIGILTGYDPSVPSNAILFFIGFVGILAYNSIRELRTRIESLDEELAKTRKQ